METNLKDYVTRASWMPQQNQLYAGRMVTRQDGRQQLPQPKNPGLPKRAVSQQPRAREKMPRVRTLALVRTLKRGLAVASILGFGSFSWLVASYPVGSTTSQSTQTSSKSSQTTSTSHASSQASNNFLKQTGNNIGTSTAAKKSSSASSTPVSGTSTS